MKGKLLPVVVGVEIPLDEFGRYNLNTLHKASGEGKSKTPNKWLETKQAKELIRQLEAKLLKTFQTPNSGSAQKVINTINGGMSPGTFAHELIAVSYAGWIRPDFQLDVNQAFIDFKSGNSGIGINALPSLDHMVGRFDELRHQLAKDEKNEAELLSVCSQIMNARKKTKGKRHKMISALKDVSQLAIDFDGNSGEEQ
ncbi:KilA-N domain-containing protein [Xenorhabdus bovienii]|uniref:KilA-N domain-containing protein n=2 Tax=Xenorhabdus bovienii TaxID=40576 RepID=A0AAJ1JAW0_XENBV|nr:KilA-N domain-containing protein [Xenorhabdus bovienii]MDE1480224.1 KilA-N domain-containing protein [Xenorhabdus bovienii]MDE9480070.1 KilA-N domain-containing protein [Xenorhabdus bovienii]MDE9482130.1 KilA-N domain-containing protein [Xenorhabdus bovienii]MDE9512009.1 KilA-N domain-containing protein [Xenorhabdus bovienii]MDE9523673.1 KilA-N domain-containing protein [Xenorhabdus bovienii]